MVVRLGDNSAAPSVDVKAPTLSLQASKVRELDHCWRLINCKVETSSTKILCCSTKLTETKVTKIVRYIDTSNWYAVIMYFYNQSKQTKFINHLTNCFSMYTWH